MNVKSKIKTLLATRCMTFKELARKMTEKTGDEYSYASLMGKIHRESLSLKEADTIAQILNYKLDFIDIAK